MLELREIGPDIFLLKISVPLNVASVNLYIFRGEVPTLLDAGTNTPAVYKDIQAGLKQLGIKHLDQVIATHWHVDHAGGTDSLAQEGARILIGARDYEEWSGFARGETFDMFQQWAELEWGVPRDELSTMFKVYDRLRFLASLPDEVEKIATGEVLRAGNTSLKAIFTPGHTAGHLSFYEEENTLLFSGDMLLPDQVSYPGIWLDNGQVVSGLPSYMNSLDVLEGLGPKEYFPAHGVPQGKSVARCQEVRAQILKQVERFTPQATVYEGALQLSKGKINPGVMFIQLHYVYGWEKLKEELDSLKKGTFRF